MFVIKNLLLHILKWVVAFFFISTIAVVLLYKVVPVYVTPLMVIRCVQQLSSGNELRLKHHWVPLKSIKEDLPIAVMASEDQRFLRHHGFDVKEIEAAAIDRIKGARRRGGSTISQQTAKNVFLWPASSWTRKGFEVYFTALIELVWGKERIMEVYLNSIEMGRGIYGAQAVAKNNFGCDASQLTRSQCALVAATLPNPLKFDSANPTPYLKKRRKAILREMRYVRRMVEKEKSK